MRRFPTMLASASAAALTTLAITVAVPAVADNAGGEKSVDEFAACLRDHGLAGAPDDASLKSWLGARLERGDAAAERAMAACGSKPVIVKRPGPSEVELRACLTKHGVDVPGGDGKALKRWIMDHGDDAASRDAMKACEMAPPGKPAGGGPCGEERGVVTTGPGTGRAGKPATAESRSASAN